MSGGLDSIFFFTIIFFFFFFLFPSSFTSNFVEYTLKLHKIVHCLDNHPQNDIYTKRHDNKMK